MTKEESGTVFELNEAVEKLQKGANHDKGRIRKGNGKSDEMEAVKDSVSCKSW